MAPKKKARTTQGVRTLRQAQKRPTQTSRTSIDARMQGTAPHPFGLTNSDHIARYNALSSRRIVATRYFDDDLLTNLGLMDNIHWLFARGGLVQFLET